MKITNCLLFLALAIIPIQGYAASWTIETIDQLTKEKRVFMPETNKDWDMPMKVFSGVTNLNCKSHKERKGSSGKTAIRQVYCTVSDSIHSGFAATVACLIGKPDHDEANMALYSNGEHYGTIIISCK